MARRAKLPWCDYWAFVWLYVFAKKNKIPFLQILDVTCVAGSQGVFWGRIGNFINGELYGRVSEVPGNDLS